MAETTLISQTLLHRTLPLLHTPTAPFREDWLCAQLDRLLAHLPGAEAARDRFGNRIVRIRRPGRTSNNLPPVTFVAHMDHPGFIFRRVAESASTAPPWRYPAVFEGRVDDSYFLGAPVRLFRTPDDSGIPGVIESATTVSAPTDQRTVVIVTQEPADGALLAMWDLPSARIEGTTLQSRACDDLLGCAAIVETLARLAEETDADAAAVFTRAEEAGFCGALCLVEEPHWNPLLSRESLFISVEISGETADARPGSGPIIRLCDRATDFDPAFAESLARTAAARGIPARTARMDQGTCEATVFARAGFRTAGLCIPLRNYHNMDRAAHRLAAEEIDLGDYERLVELLVLTALSPAQSQLVNPNSSLNFEFFLNKGRDNLCESPAGASVIP